MKISYLGESHFYVWSRRLSPRPEWEATRNNVVPFAPPWFPAQPRAARSAGLNFMKDMT